MREVKPWKTTDGDSVKLPNKYGYAWEGANGEIIMNNDPQYNPNSDPNLTPTQWTGDAAGETVTAFRGSFNHRAAANQIITSAAADAGNFQPQDEIHRYVIVLHDAFACRNDDTAKKRG